MRRQAKLLLAVVAALSVGLFASATLTKPAEALASEDIEDTYCPQGTGRATSSITRSTPSPSSRGTPTASRGDSSKRST